MLSRYWDAESAIDLFTETAAGAGQQVILWTCRCGERLTEAVEWCRMFGLEFDAVNENVRDTIERYGTESRKISADVYVDDRSCFPWMPESEWKKYLNN